MLYATGQTFQHKEALKRLGGSWDNIGRRWKFEWATSETQEELKKLLGVVVTGELDRQSLSVEDDEDITEFIRSLVGENRAPPQREGQTAVYGDDPTYLNYFRDQNPTAFFGFSSLYELIKHVAAIDPARIGHARGRGWENRYSERKWFGTADMNEALKLARDGWKEGLDGLTELEIPQAERPRRSRAVSGGNVNIGRMLSGDPRHMNRRAKQPGQRTITLFVETFMSAAIDPDNAIIRARLVAAMADALERQGYSCEIVAVLTTSSYRSVGHQAAVTLKASGERLNLLDVIFALGHPSFFRRLLFACVGAADECESTWSSQGTPSTAFDNSHPCRKNEFYVRQLSIEGQNRFERTGGEPLDMLPIIKPHGLMI